MMPQNKIGLTLITALDSNKEPHLLLSEFISEPIACQFNRSENGNYLLSFKLDDDTFREGESSDTFFEKPLMIKTPSISIMIYSYNVESINIHYSEEEIPRYEIAIREFRAYANIVDDNIWKNAKQAAHVKYHTGLFNPDHMGILFNTEAPNGILPNKAVRIKVKEVELIFYYENIDKEHGYLFFLSNDRANFKLFEKVVNSILVACGIMSGCYLKDNIFFLSVEDDKKKQISFSYTNTNKSIYHKYPLILRGRYEHLKEENYSLTGDQFNNLVNLFYSNEEYFRSALLLISAGGLNGCTKASSGAVALETISNVIARGCGGKKIIDDKENSRKIIYELRKTFKRFNDCIDRAKFDIIDNKLSQINSAPNASKLEDSFLDNGITLSNSELFALKCRNFILHGSLPKDKKYNALSEAELLDLVAHRLVMLASMLLFKLANYDERIIDWGMTEFIKKRHIMSGKKAPRGTCLRDISQSVFDPRE